jgi:hypothetical protein
MAYVSISAGLLADVVLKIHTMRDAERKPYIQSNSLTIDPDSPFMVALIYGEHAHLKHQIPVGWLWTDNDIRARFVDTTSEGREFTHTLKIDFGRQVPLPRNVTGYGDSGQNVITNLEAPEIKEYADKNRADMSIIDRWKIVEEQVTNFLKNCKSLNEGLKLWPQLSMYIPSDDIARVERKTAKVKEVSGAAASLATMDTDMLIGSAVIARMSGAVLT